MEPVVAFGTVRPGLSAEIAKRGLHLVSTSQRVRAGLRFVGSDAAWANAVPAIPTLHVVRGGDAAVAAAIDAGADDAVAVSASDGLIAARLAALVRRLPAALRLGPLLIDRVERSAMRDGRALGLLPREYRLLLHLAEQAGQIVSQDALLSAVWGLRFHPGTNLVAAHVSRLRAKLDRDFDQAMLHTEKGLGYRLAVPETRG
ncbi:winged helix-turn-helix domain-containing protein [Sphingomonas sp. MMS24-J45]|uniref:winged helix-turn-helix domain-containing protein n=1 Tax=Sphingomonas sp. MMS24-J45 TaxID=3238806 RepID=UPI00384C69F8